MRGAEPAALAGPLASAPRPRNCVQREDNKAPVGGPRPGQGMAGTWRPGWGPGGLASWPEGRGHPFAQFEGGGEGWIYRNGQPVITDKKNLTFEEASSRREGIQLWWRGPGWVFLRPAATGWES